MILNNRYQVIKSIGSGGMGQVFQAADLRDNGKVVAVKTIGYEQSSLNLIKHFKNEFRIMKQLDHPNLVKAYDFGFDRKNKLYFLVMECLDGQSLEVIKAAIVHIEERIAILISLLRALEFIHTRNILFRDLKPENVFCNPAKKEVKLFDFGLSDYKKAESLTVKGSVQYLSPEVIHKGKIDQRSDIFSLGILMAEMFSNNDFYTNEELPEILSVMSSKKMFNGKLKLNLKKIADSKLQRIVKKALAYQADSRYSNCSEIIDDFNKLYDTEKYPVETLATKSAYIQECDYFDYTGCVRKTVQFFKKADFKVVAISGDSGSGKTRALRELKFYCQLHNINILNEEYHTPHNIKSILLLLEFISTETMNGRKIVNVADRQITLYAQMIIKYVHLQKQKTVIVLDDFHKYDTISQNIVRELIKLVRSQPGAGKNLKLILSTDNNWNFKEVTDVLPDAEYFYGFELSKMTVSQLKKYLKYHLGINTPKSVIDRLVKDIVTMDFTPNLIKRVVSDLFINGCLDKQNGRWCFNKAGSQ